jgi:hypothetical protein
MDWTVKLRKLIKMSPAEIRYRVIEQYRILKERKDFRQEQKNLQRSEYNFFDSDNSEFFYSYKNGDIFGLLQNPSFMRHISEPLTKERQKRFKNKFREELFMTTERADGFVANKFSFLGVNFTLPEDIEWQHDPVSLNPYETGYYRNIDIYTNDNPGDVKHVWELNRLQFMVEIAKAAYLTEQRVYTAKLEQLIKDWFQKNPYKTGIAWASALEVAVRLFSLVWVLNFYRGTAAQDVETTKILLKLIYLHGRYLSENLSLYSSPYNHLIGEAAGLFIAGYLFPSFASALRWEKKGWSILEDQISKQFYGDGASVEQATFYHHFTLGFFIQAVALKRLNGESVSRTMMKGIEKALEYGLAMTRPDGQLPYLGDIDDGRSIYFSNPTHWDFRSYQAIGAAWFARSDMKFVAREFHEDAFWLLADKDADTFDKVESREPEATCIHLAESGYSVFRDGYKTTSHYSYMDYGPLAHGLFYDDTPSAAHGHADVLAIEIAAYGESFLIDPGFSNYRGEFDWHTYFRSTAAHNTIEINGESQAKHGGIIEWSRAPSVEILQLHQGHQVYGSCAELHSNQLVPGRPKHRRYFLFVDHTFWLSLDEIHAAEPQNIKYQLSYNLHFDNQIQVKINKKKSKIKCKGRIADLHILMTTNNAKDLSLDVFEGGQLPNQGWISPTYLNRIPAPVISASTTTFLPFDFLTVYVPKRRNDATQLSIARHGTITTISNDATQYTIYYEPENALGLKTNDHEIFAKVLVYKRGQKNPIVALKTGSYQKNGQRGPVKQHIVEFPVGD